MKPSVLFVCMGNICRSPTAEGAMRALLDARGLSDRVIVDSAGTIAYHQGEPPDPRSVRAAKRRGVDISRQRARQIRPDDLDAFDLIACMDRQNRADVLALAGDDADRRDRVRLLLGFCNADRDEVPDPYYGGPSGFDDVFELCQRACEGVLHHLLAQTPEADGPSRGAGEDLRAARNRGPGRTDGGRGR